jgi:hypothetical protein
MAVPTAIEAQTYARVDVSVSVSVAPVPFAPGGRSTVSLTIHNAGPDAAGTANPGPYAIDVIQRGFIITHFPPPYEIRNPVAGCRITETITEPLPNGDIGLVWEFYFDVLQAGASRTCTFDIEFYPFTRDSFTTGWLANPGYHEIDSNPDNNRVSYTFRAAAVPIPATSGFSLLMLTIGLFALAGLARSRAGVT